MTPDEIARLAALGNTLRPTWPATSLRTFLATHLNNRAYGDTAIALTWIATKTQTETPRLLLEPGPWWKAATHDEHTQPRDPYDRATTCGICSEPKHRCRQRWAYDHEFEPAGHSRRNAAHNPSTHLSAARTAARTAERQTVDQSPTSDLSGPQNATHAISTTINTTDLLHDTDPEYEPPF